MAVGVVVVQQRRPKSGSLGHLFDESVDLLVLARDDFGAHGVEGPDIIEVETS